MGEDTKITGHAQRRMDQRNIKLQDINHILDEGIELPKKSHGATLRTTSDKKINSQRKELAKQIKKIGKPASQTEHKRLSMLKKQIDELDKMQKRKGMAVVSEDNQLMTTYRVSKKKEKSIKRQR